MRRFQFALAILGSSVLTPLAAADAKREALWTAVRNGDKKAVEAAIAAGSDVNARNEYGVSALWIAGGKKKPDSAESGGRIRRRRDGRIASQSRRERRGPRAANGGGARKRQDA
jgi:hypothetical protein